MQPHVAVGGEEEETIAVQGEGDALMERWAVGMDDHRAYLGRNNNNNNTNDSTQDNDPRDRGHMSFYDQDGFQIQQPSRKQIKQRMRQHMHNSSVMSEEDVNRVVDPWQLDVHNGGACTCTG